MKRDHMAAVVAKGAELSQALSANYRHLAGMCMTDLLGRTIQLFLVDGTPTGLIIASIHGWTGSVLVAAQSTFDQLLARSEVDRTGVYILYGPDPNDILKMRAYIGEADSVRSRIDRSAADHGFWESAVVVTASDETLTKGHVRYLEARLIDIAKTAGRASLDNAQLPDVARRRLPEADRANMEAFLNNLKVILPVVGLDLLKPRPHVSTTATSGILQPAPSPSLPNTRFEISHKKSGVAAFGFEADGEFVVEAGSEALKDAEYMHNGYARLKLELIEGGVLQPNPDGTRYLFTTDYGFKSPSAAAAVVLDRNANGRTRWQVVGAKQTYHEWQEAKASILGANNPTCNRTQ
jgi:hypothetical protein